MKKQYHTLYKYVTSCATIWLNNIYCCVVFMILVEVKCIHRYCIRGIFGGEFNLVILASVTNFNVRHHSHVLYVLVKLSILIIALFIKLYVSQFA